MANEINTLAGLILLNDRNLADYEISEVVNEAPLMDVLHAQPASNGTLHKYLKQTGAAGSSFRDINGGVSNTASKDELVTDTLKVLDASFSADVQLADSFAKGADAYLQRETGRSFSATSVNCEKQTIYGTSNDSTGYSGINNMLTAGCVVTGGGTTADVQTSVYLLRSGETGVSLVLGNDGKLIVEEDPKIVPITDGENGTYPAYYVPITGKVGLQLPTNSYAAIKNIESSLTDDMIFDAISLFPGAKPPTQIVMNRKGQKLLRKSRTATNATGAPASMPEEVGGIPIIVTDSVKSTEAVWSA